jgi:hypothetical protein
MTGFQKTVNIYPNVGVEGARASANPRALYVTGEGGLVAGPNGVTVARFAWATPVTGGERVDSNAALVAAGAARTPSMFVGNTQQGNFTTYLAESGLAILPGMAMEGFTRGDFWCKALVAGATRGMKAFANLLDGSVSFAATGAVIASNAITASFATNVMTVTATASTLKVGQAITGTSIPANTYISALGTGTGGTGTYTLSTSPGTLSSQAAVGTDWIETNRWAALNTCLINELAKLGFGD